VSESKAYAEAMVRGDTDACLRIEQAHGLYGYPPELVSAGLAAIDQGGDAHRAIDAILGDDE